MIRYAVTWRPRSDNLGDDLLTLAASRLLPRVDMALDIDRLDAPLPDLEPDDRVVTLMCGKVLAQPIHWPPERHIAPVMVGAHFSREDVWGIPMAVLDGAGLAYLRALAGAEQIPELTSDTLTAAPGLGQSTAQVVHNVDELAAKR